MRLAVTQTLPTRKDVLVCLAGFNAGKHEALQFSNPTQFLNEAFSERQDFDCSRYSAFLCWPNIHFFDQSFSSSPSQRRREFFSLLVFGQLRDFLNIWLCQFRLTWQASMQVLVRQCHHSFRKVRGSQRKFLVARHGLLKTLRVC